MKGLTGGHRIKQMMKQKDDRVPRIVGFNTVTVAAVKAELIEDIVQALHEWGLPVRTALTAAKVRELELDKPSDLALVSIVGAVEDGLAMCRAFRGAARERRGTLVVVAAEEELGLLHPSIGADDFLLAPVNRHELFARLRLLAYRRTGLNRDGVVRLGDADIDVVHRTVLHNGVPVYLTFKEYELLHLLIRHRGSVLTRDEILRQVWGADYFGGERTVDVHIRRLRAKLGVEAARLLETIRGVGYRLSDASQHSK